jgi:hypothetical protein
MTKTETRAIEGDPNRIRSLEAEIDRVRSLSLDELRSLWRTTMRSSPPPALTKNLLARSICWQIQEQALGGLDPDVAEFLDGRAGRDKRQAGSHRRLKPGTMLVREYDRERHTVTVVPGGYLWRESIFPSLSAIARTITGTKWNGPRFFGLRTDGSSLVQTNDVGDSTDAVTRKKVQR